MHLGYSGDTIFAIVALGTQTLIKQTSKLQTVEMPVSEGC